MRQLIFISITFKPKSHHKQKKMLMLYQFSKKTQITSQPKSVYVLSISLEKEG
jgi:hypothetical protein